MVGRLFIGPGVHAWALSRELDVRWITSPPLSGEVTYPVFLDLAEAVRVALPQPWPLLEIAAHALAPTWEDLEEVGVALDKPSLPSAAELGASDNVPIVQRFLACGLAQVLARLPDTYGLLIRSAELWDRTSLEFLDRLVREPMRQVPIAIETSQVPTRAPIIANLSAHAEMVLGIETRTQSQVSPSDRVLALCPHGLPSGTLSALQHCEPAAAERFSWPGGGEGYVLSPSLAARLLTAIKPDERHRIHAAVFDIHPVAGWDYIRRSGHAVASGDAQQLMRQHTACLAGLTNVGYDFLYRHLASLATALPQTDATTAHLGAARLAPRLWGRGGRKRAARHYRCALAALGTSEAALPVMHELANLYATTRTSAALKEARRWYDSAFAALQRIADPQERRNVEIRLCNGMALVDYHEGHNIEALEREKRALDLVAASAPVDRRIALWAEPLIRTNTAKLLIKRFNDVDGAIALLESLLDNPDEGVRRNCCQDLGRACFDKGDYAGAIMHLASLVESVDAFDLSEPNELYDRFVFVLSLLALNDMPRAARQLPRMRYLASVNGLEEAQDTIKLLEDVCGI